MFGTKFVKKVIGHTFNIALDKIDDLLTIVDKRLNQKLEKRKMRHFQKEEVVSDVKRAEELQKNFEVKQKSRDQSMRDSQGEADHSGSGYHGPGNIDREKVNSNMARRNYNNHQGN